MSPTVKQTLPPVKVVAPRHQQGQMTFTKLSQADRDHCSFKSTVFDNLLFPSINESPITQDHLDYWIDQWHPLRTSPDHYKWLYVHRKALEPLTIYDCSDPFYPNIGICSTMLSFQERQAFVQQAIDVCNPFRRKTNTTTNQTNTTGTKKTRTSKAQKQMALDALAQLAAQYGCTSGKWMLRPPRGQVDQVWRIIAKATFDGKLGPSAKIAPMAKKGLYLYLRMTIPMYVTMYVTVTIYITMYITI